MQFSIKETRTKDSLCARCYNGLVMEFSDGREARYCVYSSRPLLLDYDVARCSKFDENTGDGQLSTDKDEMEKIAWILKRGRRGSTTGFAPPAPKKGSD
ncbi:hypothetical protein LCGC14_1102720 [marine sediment metagenome]|uniref:Uncharacterized protein n=1 Tax=marine sediment metagenome TaxID=412755 RepID=A0A0F9MWW4_9ZZZZ